MIPKTLKEILEEDVIRFSLGMWTRINQLAGKKLK